MQTCLADVTHRNWEGGEWHIWQRFKHPGSKLIACKNSNQNIAQTSKCTDTLFGCNCSCWQLSNFVINDKAGSTLYSKCTSIKGIPCVPPALTQPLLWDGCSRAPAPSRSGVSTRLSGYQEPQCLVPHLKSHGATFSLRKAPGLQSNTRSSITSARTRVLCWNCSTRALAAQHVSPPRSLLLTKQESDAGTGGEGRGSRASPPAPCLLERYWHRYTNNQQH